MRFMAFVKGKENSAYTIDTGPLSPEKHTECRAVRRKASLVNYLRNTAVPLTKPPHFLKRFPDFLCGGPA
jgi:hypothetical protein